jgi:hypothetical protein
MLEWAQYNNSLQSAGGALNGTKWLDIPGNHGVSGFVSSK